MFINHEIKYYIEIISSQNEPINLVQSQLKEIGKLFQNSKNNGNNSLETKKLKKEEVEKEEQEQKEENIKSDNSHYLIFTLIIKLRLLIKTV